MEMRQGRLIQSTLTEGLCSPEPLSDACLAIPCQFHLTQTHQTQQECLVLVSSIACAPGATVGQSWSAPRMLSAVPRLK